MAATYLLDANVFIQAARSYYAFDIAPTFWQKLVEHAAEGRIRSIDLIKSELLRGNDDLVAWTKNEFSPYFERTDRSETFEAYRSIITWVQQHPQFFDYAKASFASGADGWLVACAKVQNYVIVTHEQFLPDVKRKVPIPNVCREFGIVTTDTFMMLRALGVKWG
jgi:hypothetical protein